MYYSTPVYQFRMKCHLCDNHFEIKTDPAVKFYYFSSLLLYLLITDGQRHSLQNLDYEIVSGARRQENRWDPTQNEQVVPETRETSRKLFDDAMFKLEHKNNDANTSKKSVASLNKLLDRQESVWKDDFAANSILRAKLRVS